MPGREPSAVAEHVYRLRRKLAQAGAPSRGSSPSAAATASTP